MKSGSLFFSLDFPYPWPPAEKVELVRVKEESVIALVCADTAGCLSLDVFGPEGQIRNDAFQVLELAGPGPSIVSLVWEEKGASSLRINGQPVRLLSEAPREYFIVPAAKHPSLRRGLNFPQLEPSRGTTEAERLFLGTMVDIDEKLSSETAYDLTRATGLLRQLFLDERPLVHEVNRRFRLPLRFHRGAYGDELPEIGGASYWLQPDIGLNLPSSGDPITLKEFLKAPCLIQDNVCKLSVADVIKGCAHIRGGIHLGKAESDQDFEFENWDEQVSVLGGAPSLAATAAICRVSLLGLAPLVEAILNQPIHSHQQ